jgi:DNA-binding winged helix-turn-helix (wHTH) protein
MQTRPLGIDELWITFGKALFLLSKLPELASLPAFYYNSMKSAAFLIGNQFMVDPSLHLLTNRSTGPSVLLEYRLLKVLCLLAEHPGQVVSRQRLIKEVWQDYAGAEEGVNQAISLLRKALGDKAKNWIVTVPKEGYLLQAAVTLPAATHGPAPIIKPIRIEYRLTAIALVSLLTVIGITWIFFKGTVGADVRPTDQSNVRVADAINLSGNPDVRVERMPTPLMSKIGADVRPVNQNSANPMGLLSNGDVWLAPRVNSVQSTTLTDSVNFVH